MVRCLKQCLVYPADIVLHDNSTERSTTSSAMVKVKQVTIRFVHGTVRTRFRLKQTGGYATPLAKAQVYKNGVAVGTLQSTVSTAYVEFVQDLAFSEGDLYQIYACKAGDSTSAEVDGQQVRGLVAPIDRAGDATAGY